MENTIKRNEVKMRFWQKVTIAFCLISILLSLISISSSFATVSTLRSASKANAIMVFTAEHARERVRVAFPESRLSLGHNLGVDLGIEKIMM